MSEDSKLGEPSSDGGTAVEAAEPVQQPPSRGGSDKKKLWITVVVVVVAAALVGSAAYVMIGGDTGNDDGSGDTELTATLSPDPIPSVAAGGVQILSMEVRADGEIVDKTDGVDYLWSVTPSNLGSLDFYAQPNTTFTAGDAGGEGVVICEVTYEEETVIVNSSLVVNPPFIDTVSVSPSTKVLAIDAEWSFTATVIDSIGDVIVDATINWTVSGIDADDYTLNSTTGAMVTFSASIEAEVNLTATATKGAETLSGSANITIVAEPIVFERTVDYLWYDMFGPELGPWYEDRWDNYGNEYVLTTSYPYLYLWCTDSWDFDCDTWIYSMMRLNITGRNMTELNMNENPEFIPCFGDSTGGVAKLDWYMHYLTREEAEPRLTKAAYNYYDGWYIGWNGTITLDEQAAKTVLGITTTQFNNFDTWWTANSNTMTTEWEAWLKNEAGEERLDIWSSYEYPLTFVNFTLDAERSGDEIIVSFESISWGMEIMMTRWMGEAFMPTEWYMEDMSFVATIGPEMANLDIDTAAQYAVYAEVSPEDDGALVWVWEGLMQDYVPSDADPKGDHVSLFDAYEGKTYSVWGPGNAYYGETLEYAYTPGAWNLSEGETLVFEWPAGDQLFFDHDPGNTGGSVINTEEISAPMTVTYAEPMPSDMPSQVAIDLGARQIVYTGPFDMWTWVQDQTTHQNLSDEWDRLGEMLPWGIPAIQFKADTGGMLAAESGIQGELNDVEAGLDATEEELSSTSYDLDGVRLQNLMLMAVLAVPAVLAIVMSVTALSLRKKIADTSDKPVEH